MDKTLTKVGIVCLNVDYKPILPKKVFLVP